MTTTIYEIAVLLCNSGYLVSPVIHGRTGQLTGDPAAFEKEISECDTLAIADLKTMYGIRLVWRWWPIKLELDHRADIVARVDIAQDETARVTVFEKEHRVDIGTILLGIAPVTLDVDSTEVVSYQFDTAREIWVPA